jgi:hypothetical protein
MKTLFALLFIFSCLGRVYAQKTDTAAVRIVQAHLKIVADYLDQKEKSLQKISDAIILLTDLTGIRSESDGNYYAQFHPTRNDLKAWTSWLDFNKDYLFWDKEIGSLVLYKKVKAVMGSE